MWKFLLIVLCLPLASGCSSKHVSAQMPPLQANLSRACDPLPPVPVPLIDPARLQWEVDLMFAYAACAARHAATVDAWADARQAVEE